MRNLFFVLAFMLTGIFSSFANSSDGFIGKISIHTVCPEETTTVDLTFYSRADFDSFDASELVDVENEVCKVDVTVEVSIGVVTVSVTVKDVDCGDVMNTIVDTVKSIKDALK